MKPQPISTAPEGEWILVWDPHEEPPRWVTDKWGWDTVTVEEPQSETQHAGYKRRIVHDVQKRVRRWTYGPVTMLDDAYEWWMPMPPEPA